MTQQSNKFLQQVLSFCLFNLSSLIQLRWTSEWKTENQFSAICFLCLALQFGIPSIVLFSAEMETEKVLFWHPFTCIWNWGVEDRKLDSIFNTAVDFEWNTKVRKTLSPCQGLQFQTQVENMFTVWTPTRQILLNKWDTKKSDRLSNKEKSHLVERIWTIFNKRGNIWYGSWFIHLK